MSSIKLSDIKADIEARFGAHKIELSDTVSVELLNPIRLSDENRAALAGLYEEKEGEEVDENDVTRRLVRTLELAATHPEAAKKLVDACSPNGYPDLAILSEIVKGYLEGQKTGEASASQD